MIRTNLAKNLSQKGSRKQLHFSKLGKRSDIFNFKARGKSPLDIKKIFQISLAFVVGFILVLFLGQYKSWIYSNAEKKKKELNEKVSLVEKEIQKLSKFESELESYEKQKEIIKRKLNVLNELFSVRNTPVNLLDTISQSLPQKAWLKSISLKMDDNVIDLKGEALSNEDISDYLDKLKSSVYFSELKLKNVKYMVTGSTGFRIKEFEIEAKSSTQLSTFKSDQKNSLIKNDEKK